MASFTTTISEFSDSENRRTYEVSGHTVQKPKLVIQKRRVPSSTAANAESNLQVVFGTVNSTGDVLPSKIVISADARYPANGTITDVQAALAAFRDLVQSDEFTNMVMSQSYIS